MEIKRGCTAPKRASRWLCRRRASLKLLQVSALPITVLPRASALSYCLRQRSAATGSRDATPQLAGQRHLADGQPPPWRSSLREQEAPPICLQAAATHHRYVERTRHACDCMGAAHVRIVRLRSRKEKGSSITPCICIYQKGRRPQHQRSGLPRS